MNASPALRAALAAVQTSDPNVIALIPFRHIEPNRWEKEFQATWNGLPVLVTFNLWGRPSDYHELDAVTILDAKSNPIHCLDLQYVTDDQETEWLGMIDNNEV